ncbi:uncharacterized protein TRIVIDRAFT_220267 [Trichoderma virens Gv29-8]|uniref:Reverse transcriptase domain-containing protein n=1 Tax=Hypocrea virens (strain Gv29-8 / FGSC 10586) TaxID=413071 RepID=G9MKT2_HYPVG|nr:uncharacterized protein TRIVIDRAFT_220267 [Trichoderma virens Gv29-8]EHK24828.1 hypothetical protein TRIVIDRAFT_220267 [Trichoderma virens Gv29-8]
MALSKCHFAQPGLKALGHFVSRLGLNTLAEKTEAIRQLERPKTPKDLETGLGLMGYYWNFIASYSVIAEPLQKIKAIGFRHAPIKNPERATYAAKVTLPPMEPAEPDSHQRINEHLGL